MITFFALALALGKHRWKKELVSGFGKKTFVLSNTELQADLQSHDITCASWSQGPGHGVTC